MIQEIISKTFSLKKLLPKMKKIGSKVLKHVVSIKSC